MFILCYAVVNLLIKSINRWIFARNEPIPLRVVGSNGLGPSTSRLSGVCSNQLSYEPVCGGGNRVRTDDPLLAGQVLYQLSYTPITFRALRKINAFPRESTQLY